MTFREDEAGQWNVVAQEQECSQIVDCWQLSSMSKLAIRRYSEMHLVSFGKIWCGRRCPIITITEDPHAEATAHNKEAAIGRINKHGV